MKRTPVSERFLEAASLNAEALFGDYNEIPHFSDNIDIIADRLFNKKTVIQTEKTNIILGIWYAFPAPVGKLDNEGISVYLKNLCNVLAQSYDISFEVWVFSWNIEPVKRIFADISDRQIKIITELDFQGDTNEIIGNAYWHFSKLAKKFSKADLFIPAIYYLDDVVYTGKPVVAIVHDLFTVHLRELFATGRYGDQIHYDCFERFGNLLRRNAQIVTTAASTYQNQIKPYFGSIYHREPTVIRTPKNTIVEIELIDENETRAFIGTKDKYLFYPTRIRPHKNLQVLISAFAILLKKYPDLKLVLTDGFDEVPGVRKLSEELMINESIIHLSGLSIEQLYSCYKYAECTPVSTMHEAVLSWQAVEAMSAGTPVVFTDADMNRDEFEEAGFIDVIPLISGDDADGFAGEIEYVMNNKETAIKRQEPLYKALTEYTWNDAAGEYYKLFLKVINPTTC